MAATGRISIAEGGGLVYQGRYCPDTVDTIKTIPGRKYNPATREWFLPANEDILQVFAGSQTVTIDPDAYTLIQSKIQARQAVLQAKQDERPEPLKPMPLKGVKPFAHQITGFNIGISNSQAALLHEQGCGKTLTAIAIAGRRFLDGEIKRVLVVAPLSVVPVWRREFADYAGYDHSVKVLTGTMKKRRDALACLSEEEGLQVAVINFEAVWREQMFKSLLKWCPDMIVVDESQKIKGPNTNQSKGLHKLGDMGSTYKMILTGTPITATPLDFWSQYRFLDPDIFGKSFYSFRNRYAIMGGYLNKQIINYRNKEELIKKAHSIAHRVTKDDALDLPPFTDQDLYCSLEPEAARAYKEMREESIMQLAAAAQGEGTTLTATNVLTRLLRLQQLTGGYLPRDPEAEEVEIVQLSKAKLNLLTETLDDLFTAGRKVVIFARFVPEIGAILELLRDRFAFEPAYIYGAVKQDQRGAMVERFQRDPGCKAFVAQVQTAGLGITLHAADTAIFYSTDYNYGVYDQCRARVHRIGQQKNVTYIHLIAENTVDEKIYKILKNKGNIAQDIVDNWREYF